YYDPATTRHSTLALPDALPISCSCTHCLAVFEVVAMRLIDVPVRVIFAENGRPRPTPLASPRTAFRRQPAAFEWRGRTYRIARIVGRWPCLGPWWVGRGELRLTGVAQRDGGLFELYFDTAADEWRLYRIYD